MYVPYTDFNSHLTYFPACSYLKCVDGPGLEWIHTCWAVRILSIQRRPSVWICNKWTKLSYQWNAPKNAAPSTKSLICSPDLVVLRCSLWVRTTKRTGDLRHSGSWWHANDQYRLVWLCLNSWLLCKALSLGAFDVDAAFSECVVASWWLNFTVDSKLCCYNKYADVFFCIKCRGQPDASQEVESGQSRHIH